MGELKARDECREVRLESPILINRFTRGLSRYLGSHTLPPKLTVNPNWST
jgi:hypothetical protein